MSVIRQKQKLTTDHCPLATALLINSRTDVAIATAANGVHLQANDVSPTRSESSMASIVWRGRPRPRKLTTRTADSRLLSLPARSNPSRCEPRYLRRFRTDLRKERRATHRPRSSQPSLPRNHPRASPWRSNFAECPVLPASRRSRNSRHPPLPGKRYSHNRPQTTRLIATTKQKATPQAAWPFAMQSTEQERLQPPEHSQ